MKHVGEKLHRSTKKTKKINFQKKNTPKFTSKVDKR